MINDTTQTMIKNIINEDKKNETQLKKKLCNVQHVFLSDNNNNNFFQ